MRLIFVRHGEPDYEHDCLTERGRRQAAAAAERLAEEGITEIYASPNGRAQETASFTAKRLNLPVVTLDYMHEISWGGPGIPENGHPWTLSQRMIEQDDFDFYRQNWREHSYFAGNAAVRYYDMIAGKIDAFLDARGYRHAGSRFFCRDGADRTIALFSHGGSGACALAHILHLPFPYVATVLPYDFTSVIIVELPARMGEYVRARLELFNDVAHIRGLSGGIVFQEEPD